MASRGPFNAHFAQDLREVRELECLDSGPNESLDWLAERIKDYKRLSRDELIRRLPPNPDHPLRCPVSLFGILGVGRLEVAHTRALAWLLDPECEHGFGAILLEACLAHLRIKLPKPLTDIRVKAEERTGHPTDSSGRLDISIRGLSGVRRRRFHILIEAKVDASEGDQQLDKYARAASRAAQISSVATHRIFLSPDGRQPISASRRLPWVPFSFIDLCIIFSDHLDGLAKTPGYHFLIYYLTGIFRDVLDWDIPIGPHTHTDNPFGPLQLLESIGEFKGKKGCAYE